MTPLPGKPVRGSTTGRPVMALLDLLGRRWTLRILWELRTDAQGFRALQRACDGMSPTVLATRLTELREAGLVATDEVNRLTPLGDQLMAALGPLNDFANIWADELQPPATPPRDKRSW
ncbi:winged helix-turn-helix transcriptional regulator [Cryptosporangium phraense]|uniref:Helix-turn-helix transcriptional regulator n=1 Tax=Cryptosporangium phraense TaxID=2593070 RepID=A0A545ASA4_9ACTN|nr:helix-turn-helix domain-containing protein [Cryptosporangium phraense]TQS44217.1 helix-turn-helix transcriptional regulator [Cryptosporangium phraense]